MNETILKQNKELNLKLYPIYKALAWDLLFYYAIVFLFLTQTKGLSASDVLVTDAFYTIFKFVFTIFCNIAINKLTERKALIIGNFFVAVSIALLIVANNIPLVIISNLFSALGYNLKGLTESNILYSSVPKTENRNAKFSKIDGKGSAYYYYIDAITSLATGFLFVINGYLPMFLCLLLTIISTYLSCKFREVDNLETISTKNNSSSVKTELTDIKQGFKFIFKSNRLRHLILFNAILTAILSSLPTLRSSILTDINLPSQYFGVLIAVLQIISGISSNHSLWFHNKYRNRALQKLSMPFCFSMIVIGFCSINLSIIGYLPCVIILLAMFIIQTIVKGPYYTLIKTYLSSFATHTMRTKILTASDLCHSIARTILSFLCSALLGITTTDYVFIIVGCLLTLFLVLLLDKMRHTVGLKPEEYSKKDIEFTEVH